MGDLASARTRDSLNSFDAFASRFGGEPTHVVHAPGRVNLIGGHIDYHGLSVLPIAIDRGIDLHFRPRPDPEIRAVTLQPGQPGASFEISASIPSAEGGHWSNYLRGPAQSLAREGEVRTGLDVLVASTLPPSVGLSSSSALAVAMGLAIATANGIEVDREPFAGQMADAERYTGTLGGGMDQAASLLGAEGHALHMHFSPLRVEAIAVPPGVEFIVAHSLETASKSGSSRSDYNERRQRGEAALRIVVDALDMPPGSGYSDLLAVDGLPDRCAGLLRDLERKYFRHVVTEGRRVVRAVEALRASDLRALGALMCESHESLRADYGVSTANLDELVSIAMGAGALGARLTGAGFGGAVIIVAEADLAPSVLSSLTAAFYEPRGGFSPGQSGHLFRVRPSGGARVTRLDGRSA